MGVNEIKLNGVTLMSVREDSVAEDNLLLNETATNSAGEKIKGELDPVTEEELDEVKEQLNELSDDVYKVSDEEGEIEETDYIPFNDISDVEKPKKKALLSSIIDKIKSAFLPKTWGHVELIQSSDVLTIKDKEVDASESDNGITAIHYPSSNDIVDNNSRILSRYEAVVKPNGDIYAKMYARNYDTNGNTVGSNSIEAGVDKSGNSFYYVTDPDKFRKAINTIDQMGTKIPANSDLDDYVTAGTYYVENNTDAGTISNMPLGVAYSGKLIVLDMDSNVRVDQIYITNFQTNSLCYMYIRQIGNDGVARPWREFASTDDISPANVGNGYAEATVSGSAITATITGFKLRAGVIVAIRIVPDITSACTLNINNTGAKSVKFWSNEDVSFGKVIGGARITTFIYDGTYYRVISIDRTPYVGNQSYVADTSGNILIDWGYGVNRAQLKYNIGANKLLWNYYKNSAWRGDKQLFDVVGEQTMEGWLGLKVGAGRTIASGAHSLGVSDTIPNILNELRFSNGAWGSFNLGTAYTKDYTTIPTGWYNYFYIPHRVGGENWAKPTTWDADNISYGTLMLFGMNNTNGMFRIRMSIVSDAVNVSELEDLQKGNCYVGTCTTAGATKDKVATVDGNFVLRKGVRVAIKFSNNNTYSNVTTSPITLNVNGTGAKNIWYNTTHSGAGNTGTNTTAYGVASRYVYYVYDGTYWVWDGCGVDNNTTYSAMSVSELTTGTATSQRTVRADYLKTGIETLITNKTDTSLDTSSTNPIANSVVASSFQTLATQTEENTEDIATNLASINILKNNGNWRTGLRFKNLGTSFTSAQATALTNGDFSEFWNGDYWVINGHNWRIVDNSGWARSRGDTNFDSNSLVVMPDDNLVVAQAYLIDGYTSQSYVDTHGYANCGYRTDEHSGYGRTQCKTLFQNAFGSSHVASHRELMSTSRGTGGALSWAWQDADVELPSEVNIYGHSVWGNGLESGVDEPSFNIGDRWGQFMLFRLAPYMAINRGQNYWLRDIHSASAFALVNHAGTAVCTTPSSPSVGLRPYSIIK